MLDMPTVIGMTPEERKSHLGPNAKSGAGSRPHPKSRVTGGEAFVGAFYWVCIVAFILWLCWRPW